MDLTTLGTAARRFPLVGRPRPACSSLPERIKEISEIADTARQQGANGMHEAAHVLNKAALLASDCGIPELARDLCLQHIDVYRAAGTRLTVLQARYMLEPALNLARLQIRAKADEHALRLLDAMYQAVTNNTDLVIEGRTVPLANLAGTREEHHKLREWVWLQYLADGIRALALAGRWDEAVTHATAHRGIGLHLMEGRQAAIIAHCLRGAPQTGRALLEESTLTEPWGNQIASCLRVMCAATSRAAVCQDISVMVERFLGQEPRPGYVVFRARIGLTVATLTSDADAVSASRVLAQVAAETVKAGDGYAAREVLGYRNTLTGLTDAQREALTGLVAACGLGSRALPEPLLGSFTTSAEIAKKVLAASMRQADPRMVDQIG